MNRYIWLRNFGRLYPCGIYTYNRNTIEFDNGSRIQATTTTEDTGRGKS